MLSQPALLPTTPWVHTTEVCSKRLASHAFSEVVVASALGHRVSCGPVGQPVVLGFKLNFSGGEDLISSKFI